MIDKQLLTDCAATYGVEITPTLADRLDIYARLLVEWNEKMNLTAITDPTGIVVKHFTDSLLAAPLLPTGSFSLIDVGTGAGFPGMPLALLREDCHLTLLDSLNKRLVFLEAVCRELGLPATLIHARAEEGGRRPDLREQFDVSTARAVAALPTLCEYCLPFVKVGGCFIALKGPDADREQEAAARAVSLLGGKVAHKTTVTLQADTIEPMERQLIRIDKTRPTSSAYPRPSAKIAKRPL